MICPWAVNVSKMLWGADATDFRPDRWLADEGDMNHKGGSTDHLSFLSFLHGSRSCIGQMFAQAELACLLATWVTTFDSSLKNYKPLSKRHTVGGIWVVVRRSDI